MPAGSTTTKGFNKGDGVALREYLEHRIVSQGQLLTVRLEALEKASDVAASALKERLAGMNEFRDAMGDLSNRMVTRDEYALQVLHLQRDLADLKKSRDEATGKASQTSVIVSMLFGVAGIIFGIVNLLTG